MIEEKRYTLINIIADDAAISIEEKLTSEQALKRYFELKEFSEEISIPKSIIFLIEGTLIRTNKKDLKNNE